SGRSIGAICRYYRIEPATGLIIVYDDINLELAHLRISTSGGAGGHNGLRSLIRHLGSEFLRFRIGIGPRYPAEISLSDFVLGKFSREQKKLLKNKENEFLEALHLLIDSGPNSAMNQVNQKQKIQNEPNESEL